MLRRRQGFTSASMREGTALGEVLLPWCENYNRPLPPAFQEALLAAHKYIVLEPRWAGGHPDHVARVVFDRIGKPHIYQRLGRPMDTRKGEPVGLMFYIRILSCCPFKLRQAIDASLPTDLGYGCKPTRNADGTLQRIASVYVVVYLLKHYEKEFTVRRPHGKSVYERKEDKLRYAAESALFPEIRDAAQLELTGGGK